MRRRALSSEDREHLQQLEPKLKLIRDRVRGVAASIHPFRKRCPAGVADRSEGVSEAWGELGDRPVLQQVGAENGGMGAFQPLAAFIAEEVSASDHKFSLAKAASSLGHLAPCMQLSPYTRDERRGSMALRRNISWLSWARVSKF